MTVTKTALILGVTLLSLIGTVHYLNTGKNDTATMINASQYQSSGIQDLELRVTLFKLWMQKYKKMYGLAESHMRFALWNKAYDFVQEHNAKKLSWTVGMNQFADLTDEEFSAMYLGFNWDPTRVDSDENIELLDETAVPTNIDWRTEGAVTDVKYQGNCGSCWAFSTTGAMEGLYYIKNGTLLSFSEQQLVDCSYSYGNQGCYGGLMDYAFQYTKDNGLMQESDYPYKAASGTCQYDASEVVSKNKGYTDVAKNNPTQLKAAVAKQPVSIAVEADQNAFKLYTSGIVSANCGSNLDHAVLIVGYASNYWIVKNSWGTRWGEQGYIRIASGTQNGGAGVCGINSSPSYPTA